MVFIRNKRLKTLLSSGLNIYLVGSSGSGKTTLLHSLLEGEDRITIHSNAYDINNQHELNLRKNGSLYVLEDSREIDILDAVKDHQYIVVDEVHPILDGELISSENWLELIHSDSSLLVSSQCLETDFFTEHKSLINLVFLMYNSDSFDRKRCQVIQEHLGLIDRLKLAIANLSLEKLSSWYKGQKPENLIFYVYKKSHDGFGFLGMASQTCSYQDFVVEDSEYLKR